jgi:hypothetical protein
MEMNFDNLRIQIAKMYNSIYKYSIEKEDTDLKNILEQYRIYIGMLLLCESHEQENFESLTVDAEKLLGGVNETN